MFTTVMLVIVSYKVPCGGLGRRVDVASTCSSRVRTQEGRSHIHDRRAHNEKTLFT